MTEDAQHGVGVRQRIGFSIVWIAMLATGYVVGWIHGASQYERSAVWFMAGIVVTSLFVMGMVGIDRVTAQEGDSA
jgi:hypothetical protein